MTRPTLEHDDEGFALVTVLGSMAVVTLFLLSSLAFALSNMAPSRADQDSKAAIAAAQAGIEEYVSRLNASYDYWQYGNADCSNLALQPPPTAPCMTPRPAQGVPVPGTTGPAATFSYQLLSTSEETAATGSLRLQVTGRSMGETRDLIAELSPTGFLKYIYFTDLESRDPALDRTPRPAMRNGVETVDDTAQQAYLTWTAGVAESDRICSSYWYEGRSNPSYTVGSYLETAEKYNIVTIGKGKQATTEKQLSGEKVVTKKQANASNVITFTCSEIGFTNDKINGPLKTNDAMLLAGTTWFTSRATETGWATAPVPTQPWRSTASGTWSPGTADEPGYPPVTAAPLELPASNDELRQAAGLDGNGCVYTGATRLTFTSDGRMTVTSPATPGTVPRCYPGGSGPFTLDLPSIVYVQDATTCTDSVGFPQTFAGGTESTVLAKTTDYDCRRGNAYISGSLQGRVTVGTANDIVVVGDTTYAGGLDGTDALGLIPQNYAWVYNPVRDSGSTTCAPQPGCRAVNLLPTPVRNIDAAILAVQHSFLVQNWNTGNMHSTASDLSSHLTVRGAIAQKFRGPVAANVRDESGVVRPHGYLKNYIYDERLLNAPPPYFLKPATSPWGVHKVTD